MDVRSDEEWTSGNRCTYKRVPSQPLNLLTQNVPPTAKTDDLEGPACRQSGDPHSNDLETCKKGCQWTIEEEKGQLNANRMESLLWSVKTDDDKGCNM